MSDATVWLLIMGPVLVFIIFLRSMRHRSTTRSATSRLQADAVGLSRSLADGRHEDVRWDDVTQVDVFTTRVGPHREAGGAVVFYGDEAHGCIVPLDRLGESRVVEHLGRLPGFDIGALLAAADPGPTEGPTSWFTPRPLARTTVIWRRAPEA